MLNIFFQFFLFQVSHFNATMCSKLKWFSTGKCTNLCLALLYFCNVYIYNTCIYLYIPYAIHIKTINKLNIINTTTYPPPPVYQIKSNQINLKCLFVYLQLQRSSFVSPPGGCRTNTNDIIPIKYFIFILYPHWSLLMRSWHAFFWNSTKKYGEKPRLIRHKLESMLFQNVE